MKYLVALVGLGITFGAFAQDSTELEEIVVTGSRIVRNTLVTPTPMTIIDAEAIEISGATNIGDLLNQLPALGSTRGSQNSDRFIGTAGLNLLDLRRLGTARTLVLVDGQRHVAGNIGSAAVDVNSIPAALIERVEVITGGASAVYGADAVTGVVNFILKHDFEGIQLDIQTGRSEDGLDRSSLDILAGFNFAEDRGNAVLAFEYSETGDLSAADRGLPAVRLVRNPLDMDTQDADGNEIHDGIPDELLLPGAGLSIITNGGWFTAGGINYVFDAPNSFREHRAGTDFGSSECGEGCDFLDLTSFVNLSTPQQRYAVSAMMDYRLVGDHTVRLEGKYVNSQASGSGQPHFNFFTLGIADDNAFLPDGLDQILTDAETTSFNLNRFNVDTGLRGQVNERQTSRVLAGLSGPLTERLDYDVNLIYGRTTSSQLSTFNRINERFFAAADAVLDAEGNIVCRHTLDPDSDNTSLGRPLQGGIVGDCIPVNLFGDGAPSRDAIDYFSTTATRHAEIDQAVANAVVTGSLFDLPAGELGFAAGLEYRKETSNDQPDALNALGLTFGNVLQAEQGNYSVREAFAELRMPLLRDLPLVHELSVDLAGRWSDYSTIGDTFTYKYGLEYAPFEVIKLRGTYSEAVRAPNIGELFGPQNQTFFGVLDPCSEDRLDLGRNGRATREANCRALGVPVGFDARDEVTREGLSGGNPLLAQEESESFTVGLVFTPTDRLGVALDYWDINIDGAISSASAQDILNRCVDFEGGISNEFCALITRDDTNNITLIRQVLANIAALEASGYDLEASYSFPLAGGEFGVRLVATYLEELNSFPFQSDPTSREQEAGGLGDPEYSGQLDLGWQTDRFGVNWSARYLDSMLLIDQEDFDVNPDARDILFTGDTLYHDVNARLQVSETLTVSFGVDNLFDDDAPAFLTGTGGGSGIFDNIGRFYYGSVRMNF